MLIDAPSENTAVKMCEKVKKGSRLFICIYKGGSGFIGLPY